MEFKKFRLKIILRIIFLSLTIGLFFWCLYFTEWRVTSLLILCLAIYQIYSLIYFSESINRDISRFLISLKHQEFSQSFNSNEIQNKELPELKEVLKIINHEFQKLSNEKEIHFRYLQTVLEHISTGLIAFDEKGEITLYNKAARQMFKIMHLKNLDALEKFYPELYFLLKNIRAGEKELLALKIKDENLQLAITATEVSISQQVSKIIGIQNIKKELDINELDAWQKLIRVLTHEIMNSVTPISSLANSTLRLFKKENENVTIEQDNIDDVLTALSTIEKRSHGLLNFVDVYRNLSRIPKPAFTRFMLGELLGRIQNLFKETMLSQGIALDVQCDSNLEAKADINLLEQVLINLLLNAKDAVSESKDKRIKIYCYIKDTDMCIEVQDSGEGMDSEVADKIFIPFFTTKSTGSGIGLNLARQIMKLHNGTINVVSEKNKGSVFTLRW